MEPALAEEGGETGGEEVERDARDGLAERRHLLGDDELLLGLPELAAEAAARVTAQMAKHGFHGEGEAWLSKGLERIVDEDCPFCGASVAGNALIEAYQGYFSEAYAAHVKALLPSGGSSGNARPVSRAERMAAQDRERPVGGPR